MGTPLTLSPPSNICSRTCVPDSAKFIPCSGSIQSASAAHSLPLMQSAMATSSSTNPRVGVAAVIQGPDGKVVFGRRKSSHGAGQWAFPGGHLEYGEDFKQCAERETLEETGLRVKGRKIAHVTNDVFTDLGKHYITVFVICEMLDQGAQPALLEPDKCEGWVWKTLDEIRQARSDELFLPIQNLLKELPNLNRFLDLDA